MGTGRISREIPARVEGLRRRLERWRGTRRAGTRIPEALWVAAVKVAGRYGIHRTARVLRLDYYSLQRRVEQEAAEKESAAKEAAAERQATANRPGERKSGGRDSKAPAASVAATFVELPAPARAACGECTLELERPGGAKLRAHLKGVPAADVAAIGRGLWQGEP